MAAIIWVLQKKNQYNCLHIKMFISSDSLVPMNQIFIGEWYPIGAHIRKKDSLLYKKKKLINDFIKNNQLDYSGNKFIRILFFTKTQIKFIE